MKTQDFQPNMPGEFVRTPDGFDAFLPHPLPPALVLPEELWGILSAADRAVGQLSGVGDLGGVNPHLLIRPFVRREAVLSSQIEGTHATLSDLLLFEQDAPIEKQVPDVREVSNYVLALEAGLESLKHRPLGCGLIKALHEQLMRDVRGGDKTPGAFRAVQVVLGSSARIDDARFVPPPATHVDAKMRELETYLQAPSKLPALIRMALVHYQFESIHPFEDGNGRIGRLLITLMVCNDGLLPLPLLYLSAYLEKNRPEYYQRLLEVSQKAAWIEWLIFFLRGVASQATDAVARIRKLARLREQYQAQAQKARASALAIRLIDRLFESPAINMTGVCRLLDVTPASAQAHIDRLVKASIVKEATGLKRNRVYLATGILEALNEDPI